MVLKRGRGAPPPPSLSFKPLQGYHLILARGAGLDSVIEGVQAFFETTLLLHYDSVVCRKGYSLPAEDLNFWDKVEEGIAQNRKVLSGFVKEFEGSGGGKRVDLSNVAQGYQSKLLHIITHFLDGFIGIDTVFYNLCDDSHWLPEETRRSIKENPGHYWLIHVDTAFSDRQTASLI